MDDATQNMGAADLQDEVAALFDSADEATSERNAERNDSVEDAGGEPELDLSEDDGAEGDEEGESQDEDPEVELKIDGETKKVKLSELKADAQKYHAANKKFEEAAAIRKEAEAVKARIPEQEKQLNNVLTHYIQQSQALMQQEPNWRELLAYDQANGTQHYNLTRLDWEAKQRDVMQAQQAKQLLDQREAEARTASNQQRLAEERVKLQEAVPEWKDPVKAAEGAKAIGSYLKQQGIPDELLGSLDSASVVLIARKAMLYDQAVAKRQQAQTTTRNVQVVEKPAVSANVTPKSQVQRMNAGKAFKANPSVDTLSAFFE
jgi:hypothetical protein